jgi:hypothetical protein
MISRLLSVLVLGALFASPLHAVTVENLFSASVPVADRSATETERGVGEAFNQVIIKLTGRNDMLGDPRVRKLAARARSLVTVVGQAQSGNATDGYRLRVDFDAEALSTALRQAGIALWSRDRPRLTTLLVVETPTGRHVGEDEITNPVFTALAQSAIRRGLPLLRKPAAPRAGGEPTAVLAALLGPDPTPGGDVGEPQLAGVLTQRGDGDWAADWQVRVNGLSTVWNARGADPLLLTAGGIDRAADLVAGVYTTAGDVGGEVANVELSVDGIRSAADYGRVLGVLRGFDIVEKLGVRQATADRVRFTLAVRGGPSAIRQSLQLNGQLQPNPGDPALWSLSNP